MKRPVSSYARTTNATDAVAVHLQLQALNGTPVRVMQLRNAVASSLLVGVALGCSDPTAANYLPAAFEGADYPCVYGAPTLYCGDSAAINFDASSTAAGVCSSYYRPAVLQMRAAR